MPSVVLMNPFDAIAGSQRVAIHLAQALGSDGFKIELHLGFGSDGFVSKLAGVKTFLDINNIRCRKLLYPLWLISVVPRVLRATLKGDLVWANTVYAAPATLAALVLSPKRVVLHIHEIEFPRIFRPLLRFAAYRGATLLCVSDFHRRALRLNAQVLPNCVALRIEEKAPSQQPRLVFVGNTSPAKGFQLFIEVTKQLAGSGLGAVAFLPNRERCDPALLAQAQAEGVCIRYGVTDAREMYADGYLSLLSTDPALWTETFSLVAAESLSCLVPVVSAGTEVVKEILGDALAFDEPGRNPQRIASEIRELLAHPQRYAMLVEACRQRRNEFSFERFRERARALVSRLSTPRQP